MLSQNPIHESSSLYHEALEVFRAVISAARTDSRRLNDALRDSALRFLQHCACAAGAPTARAKERSLRYARIAATKLYAAIDATWCDGQLSDRARDHLRECLYLALTAGQAISTTTPSAEEEPELDDGFEVSTPEFLTATLSTESDSSTTSTLPSQPSNVAAPIDPSPDAASWPCAPRKPSESS